MVEIFKTNITNEKAAAILLERLQHKIPEAKINFDLEDCDHILRVESDNFTIEPITDMVKQYGYDCEVLE